uniref:VWFA domain-containing protein n=1 Tax=Aplanochytrium stocchinoi TaxID=215587 RepID=A0A7S3PH36_9STRA|mmetsp:Transcript_16229/g.19346  ORF Transcript_16229/g.19346 Transcript_16229/m.19346 type:complete len:914 (+) Transcript_16229:15-2756(+)
MEIALIVFLFSFVCFPVKGQFNLQDVTSDGTGPSRLIMMLDASNSIDRDFFYSDLLDTVEHSFDALEEGSELGVIVFKNNVKAVVPLSDYTKVEWIAEIDRLRLDDTLCCRCCTPVAEALEEAAALIKSRADYSMKTIALLFTDGSPFQNTGNGEYSIRTISRAEYLFDIVPNAVEELENVNAKLVYVNIPDTDQTSAEDRSGYFRGDFSYLCQLNDLIECSDEGNYTEVCTRRQGSNQRECINITYDNFPLTADQFTLESIDNIDQLLDDFCKNINLCIQINEPTLSPTFECTTDFDCRNIGNESNPSAIPWSCINNICEQNDATASTAVFSTVIAVTLAGYAAAAAGVAGGVASGGSGMAPSSPSPIPMFEFLGMAQYIAAGSMMNLPSGPPNYVNLATNLGWTTGIFIPMGNTVTDDGGSRRRLDAFDDDAMQRYLSVWNIEPQFLFLSLSLSLMLIFCVLLTFYIASKYVKYWLRTRAFTMKDFVYSEDYFDDSIGPQAKTNYDCEATESEVPEPDREPESGTGTTKMISDLKFEKKMTSRKDADYEINLSTERVKRTAAKRAIQMFYYLAFPISLAAFYQLNLLSRVPDEGMVRTTIVVFAVLIVIALPFYFYLVYICVKETLRMPPPNPLGTKDEGSISTYNTKHEYSDDVKESPYYPLIVDWRYECRTFWVAKMAVNILRGAILGFLVTGTPRPIQAVMFLIFALVYMFLIWKDQPYKTKGQNNLALFVAFLYIPSTILLLLFALDPAPYDESSGRALGTTLNVINFAILLGMGAVAFYSAWGNIRTFCKIKYHQLQQIVNRFLNKNKSQREEKNEKVEKSVDSPEFNTEHNDNENENVTVLERLEQIREAEAKGAYDDVIKLSLQGVQQQSIIIQDVDDDESTVTQDDDDDEEKSNKVGLDMATT